MPHKFATRLSRLKLAEAELTHTEREPIDRLRDEAQHAVKRGRVQIKGQISTCVASMSRRLIELRIFGDEPVDWRRAVA